MIVLSVIDSVGYLGRGRAKRNNGISAVGRSLLGVYTGLLLGNVSQLARWFVYGSWQRNDIGKTDVHAGLRKWGKSLLD